MTDAQTTERPKTRRRRHGRIGLGMVAIAFTLSAIVTLIALSLSGRPLVLPGWVGDRIEAQLNKSMAFGQIELGETRLVVDPNGMPRIVVRNVQVRDGTGLGVATLNEVGARLSPRALSQGSVLPSLLRLSGAQITVRRGADGQFALLFGSQTDSAIGGFGALLEAVNTAFASDPLAGIARIEARELNIALEDARSGRIWQATNATLTLDQTDTNLAVTIVSEVFNGTEELAELQLSFRMRKGGDRASFGANFENVAARDIALQSPVLTYLEVLDAPISGAMRATLHASGEIGQIAGTLDIGAGALQPTPETRPIGFDRGRAYFTFDPDSQKITFSEVSVETEAARIATEGHAYLRDLRDGWPDTLLGQFDLTEVELNPDGMFAAPVVFSGGAADLRLQLDPFAVTLGQVVMVEGQRRFSATGRIDAAETGWKVALDGSLNELDNTRLLALWPAVLTPGTRIWLDQNVQTASLFDIRGALRLEPDGSTRMALSYDFDRAAVRYMKYLPPIENAVGRAILNGNEYMMVLDQGRIRADDGGWIDAAGSVLKIADITRDPAVAEVSLRTESSLTAALSVMNRKPFEIMKKSGRPVDLADARAAIEAEIAFDLLKDVKREDVDYRATGRLTGVRSERIVPGRLVTADELRLAITPQRISVAGPGKLDDLPIDVEWSQALNSGQSGQSRVTGEVELSHVFFETFGLDLPPGAVEGVGHAEVTLDLKRDEATAYTLTSDLAGLRMRLDEVGWSKPAAAEGLLTVTGLLGPTPQIDRLTIEAPGLTAEGDLALTEDGALEAARFDRVRLGNWFDAPVTLRGRGRGVPAAIEVTGGSVDIRNADLRGTRGAAGGGGGGQSGAVTMALDRLIVSDGIALAPFRGGFTSGAGLSGTFTGRINGRSAIRGTLVPENGRTAMRIVGDDAGAVLSDAGAFSNARGGSFDLILRPSGDQGLYDGLMRLRGVRLRKAPVMADLLDAISVVGIIDQLNGPGILFETVDASFRLTDRQVLLDEAAAVGGSLGVSMDGVYDLASKRLDMQGVISPIYILNGIGAIFTRRGEGLFGFNFRMTGDADAPRIQVNPLSILTPGMFRDIFRRPPPARAGQ